MKKRLFFGLILCGISYFLCGCGQSGRLYLPATNSLATQGSKAQHE